MPQSVLQDAAVNERRQWDHRSAPWSLLGKLALKSHSIPLNRYLYIWTMNVSLSKPRPALFSCKVYNIIDFSTRALCLWLFLGSLLAFSLIQELKTTQRPCSRLKTWLTWDRECEEEEKKKKKEREDKMQCEYSVGSNPNMYGFKFGFTPK